MNLYDQAIKLDPEFALAHARLSATISALYHFYEPTENRGSKRRMRKRWNRCDCNRTSAKAISRSALPLLHGKRSRCSAARTEAGGGGAP